MSTEEQLNLIDHEVTALQAKVDDMTKRVADAEADINYLRQELIKLQAL